MRTLPMNADAEASMGGFGQFGFDQGDQLVVDKRVPERTVAFREDALRELHERGELPIERLHYGSWCGRERHTSMQDIVVAVRR